MTAKMVNYRPIIKTREKRMVDILMFTACCSGRLFTGWQRTEGTQKFNFVPTISKHY
jgi:hypothetical protein